MPYILRHPPLMVHLHRLRRLVLWSAGRLPLVSRGEVIHLALATCGLDGAHGLTERNRNDLAIADILEQYLGIADD